MECALKLTKHSLRPSPTITKIKAIIHHLPAPIHQTRQTLAIPLKAGKHMVVVVVVAVHSQFWAESAIIERPICQCVSTSAPHSIPIPGMPHLPSFAKRGLTCISQLSHQQQALNTPHQPTGMFTRNLIGALSASAFRLHDQNHKFGIWFILQDLSIRTDGIFRYA
jgi:Velvet factor